MILKLLKTQSDKDYPSSMCSSCGLTMNNLTCLAKYKDFPKKPCFTMSTYSKGECGVCGKWTAVTEARDFFYPNIYGVK